MTRNQFERNLQEMMNLLGRKDRTKFRNKYVYPLAQKGLLAMTISDNPCIGSTLEINMNKKEDY